MTTETDSEDPWSEIRRAVERVEEQRLRDRLTDFRHPDPDAPASLRWLTPLRRHLEVLAGIALGVTIGVGTTMFNFLLFVWILHVSF